jgi:hypothetical protein
MWPSFVISAGTSIGRGLQENLFFNCWTSGTPLVGTPFLVEQDGLGTRPLAEQVSYPTLRQNISKTGCEKMGI